MRRRERSTIVGRRKFLQRIYEDWYSFLAGTIPSGPGRVLEVGSSGSWLRAFLPDAIRSDIVRSPETDLLADGQTLPFPGRALRGIVMVNVLHHLPDVGKFLAEATRCLDHGGVLAMVEPWATPWSSWVYEHLHPEPFDRASDRWGTDEANGALPWIVFSRDRARLDHEFPDLRLDRVEVWMPFRYLLSGGITGPRIMPGWTYELWRSLEDHLGALGRTQGMFARILLVRQ